MPYRDFARPGPADLGRDTGQWINWLQSNHVLVPTAPRPDNSCGLCQGAVGERGDSGDYWDRCYQCGGYSDDLDVFVPITYSVSSGLESLLHRFKDFGDEHEWMALPLGSLLYTFLSRHRGCLDAASFGIDVATFVPSNSQTRGFSQLERMIDAVDGSPVRGWFDWQPSLIERDRTGSRPPRAVVDPDAYAVDADAVRGQAVLLLDDTWTSGASLMSCAAALKRAGATSVIGLTLGRQLNESGHYGSTDGILDQVRGRLWNSDECVVCS